MQDYHGWKRTSAIGLGEIAEKLLRGGFFGGAAESNQLACVGIARTQYHQHQEQADRPDEAKADQHCLPHTELRGDCSAYIAFRLRSKRRPLWVHGLNTAMTTKKEPKPLTQEIEDFLRGTMK